MKGGTADIGRGRERSVETEAGEVIIATTGEMGIGIIGEMGIATETDGNRIGVGMSES